MTKSNVRICVLEEESEQEVHLDNYLLIHWDDPDTMVVQQSLTNLSERQALTLVNQLLTSAGLTALACRKRWSNRPIHTGLAFSIGSILNSIENTGILTDPDY